MHHGARALETGAQRERPGICVIISNSHSVLMWREMMGQASEVTAGPLELQQSPVLFIHLEAGDQRNNFQQ